MPEERPINTVSIEVPTVDVEPVGETRILSKRLRGSALRGFERTLKGPTRDCRTVITLTPPAMSSSGCSSSSPTEPKLTTWSVLIFDNLNQFERRDRLRSRVRSR